MFAEVVSKPFQYRSLAVAARYADIVYCLCGGHAINKIDELWQQICNRGVIKRDEVWQLDLTIHHYPDWWNLAQGIRLGRQNREGCKNCNDFLVQRLAERDEICHYEILALVRSRSSPISVDFGTLPREHEFSRADISRTFCRRATKFGTVRGLVNGHMFPELCELWFGVPWHASVAHWRTCCSNGLTDVAN